MPLLVNPKNLPLKYATSKIEAKEFESVFHVQLSPSVENAAAASPTATN